MSLLISNTNLAKKLMHGYLLGPICDYMTKLVLLIRSDKHCYQSLLFYHFWDIMELLARNCHLFDGHLY